MASPDPTSGPQVLDLGVIDGLLDLGGPELLAELIELFLDDAPRRLEALEVALASADQGGVRDAAHGLKSSAANLGAAILSRVCCDLESAALRGDAPLTHQLGGAAASAYRDVDFALRRLLD
jgi:HPt (histidine-containing phosphotransfer) domain-containing protein